MARAAQPDGSSSIVTVALATALCLTGDSMLYIALPLYWREAGLDALWQVGVLLSINRLIRLPFNPLVGLFYRHFSVRTGLVLAVVIGIVSMFGYALASSFLAWLLLRALWGIGWSFFRIGGLSAVVHCAADHQRGRAMGLYNGLYRLGSLAGMLIGGLLVPVYGLQALALAFAAVSLLGVPLLLLYFRLPDRPAAVSAHAPLAPGQVSALAWRRIQLGGFCIALLVQGVLAATLSALIEHYYGSEIDLLGLLLSAAALAGLLQAARWSWETWLGARLGAWSDGPRGRVPLLIGSLGAMAMVFASLGVGLPLPVWLPLCLLAMLLCTALTTLNDALAADLARRGDVSRMMTRYSIGQDLGAALGPAMAFLLVGHAAGFAWLYGGGALLFAVLAGLWLVGRR
ncbi:MFS transporter [Stutzerimonas nosocomialis]|uniref:MFS transporter n=1 Tax=Stutzerimonas nosocomialis TaxID=1056496 RepID=A0A5R9QDK2_9GAMM|nr:MFS transporter [Stutzerimonas nosocomialis]TLX63214.1 MFS transporter [Stutzerimonas nosocomialis]